MEIFQVTVYIETSFRGPAIRRAAGMWLIEYIKSDGAPETRQGILKRESTTENALVLELLADAFSKLTKSCYARVNTECEHVLHVMQNHWLPQWEKNGWLNAKGKPVKNDLLWQQCKERMQKHTVTFGNTGNSYGSVMQGEIRKELEG